MNKTEQEIHAKKFTTKMLTTIQGKGDDYANEDRLSNFKLAGSIVGLNAELNCLNLMATKLARLGVLLRSGETPKNESVSDSLLDLANYSMLLDMIVSEKVKTSDLSDKRPPHKL